MAGAGNWEGTESTEVFASKKLERNIKTIQQQYFSLNIVEFVFGGEVQNFVRYCPFLHEMTV